MTQYYSPQQIKELIEQGETVSNMHIDHKHSVVELQTADNVENDKNMFLQERSAEFRSRLEKDKSCRGRCCFGFSILLEWLMFNFVPLTEFMILILAVALSFFNMILDPRRTTVNAFQMSILVGSCVALLLFVIRNASTYIRTVKDGSSVGGNMFILLSGKTLCCDSIVLFIYILILSIEIIVAVSIVTRCSEGWVCSIVRNYIGDDNGE